MGRIALSCFLFVVALAKGLLGGLAGAALLLVCWTALALYWLPENVINLVSAVFVTRFFGPILKCVLLPLSPLIMLLFVFRVLVASLGVGFVNAFKPLYQETVACESGKDLLGACWIAGAGEACRAVGRSIRDFWALCAADLAIQIHALRCYRGPTEYEFQPARIAIAVLLVAPLGAVYAMVGTLCITLQRLPAALAFLWRNNNMGQSGSRVGREAADTCMASSSAPSISSASSSDPCLVQKCAGHGASTAHAAGLSPPTVAAAANEVEAGEDVEAPRSQHDATSLGTYTTRSADAISASTATGLAGDIAAATAGAGAGGDEGAQQHGAPPSSGLMASDHTGAAATHVSVVINDMPDPNAIKSARPARPGRASMDSSDGSTAAAVTLTIQAPAAAKHPGVMPMPMPMPVITAPAAAAASGGALIHCGATRGSEPPPPHRSCVCACVMAVVKAPLAAVLGVCMVVAAVLASICWAVIGGLTSAFDSLGSETITGMWSEGLRPLHEALTDLAAFIDALLAGQAACWPLQPAQRARSRAQSTDGRPSASASGRPSSSGVCASARPRTSGDGGGALQSASGGLPGSAGASQAQAQQPLQLQHHAQHHHRVQSVHVKGSRGGSAISLLWLSRPSSSKPSGPQQLAALLGWNRTSQQTHPYLQQQYVLGDYGSGGGGGGGVMGLRRQPLGGGTYVTDELLPNNLDGAIASVPVTAAGAVNAAAHAGGASSVCDSQQASIPQQQRVSDSGSSACSDDALLAGSWSWPQSYQGAGQRQAPALDANTPLARVSEASLEGHEEDNV